MDSLIAQHNLQALSQENARFIAKVYLWMSIGLSITAWLSHHLASTPLATNSTPVVFWGIIAAHLISLIYISAYLKKMGLFTALFIFFIYSFLMAVSFTMIFIHFFHYSVHIPFTIIGMAFFIMAVISRIFHKDCGVFITLFLLGIIEAILYLLAQNYTPSLFGEALSHKANIIILAILTIITAFDCNRTKHFHISTPQAYSIHGALKLYTDFLNLFLFFLRLTSRK